MSQNDAFDLDKLPDDELAGLKGIDLDEFEEEVWGAIQERFLQISATPPTQPKPNGNALSSTVEQFFLECATDARKHAEERLNDMLVQLADLNMVRSPFAAIFIPIGNSKKMRRVASLNILSFNPDIEVEGDTLLASVVSTLTPQVSDAITECPTYMPCHGKIRSEMTVPVLGNDRELLAAVSFVSPHERAFGKDAILAVNRGLNRLILHLEVLKSLRLQNDQFAWHPELHGWNFSQMMTRLCRRVTTILGQGVSTCSAWYGDWDKSAAYAFSTYGYDFEYACKETLPLHTSKVGLVMASDEEVVVTFDPRRDPVFLERKKAETMGIDEGHMIRVPPLWKEGRSELLLSVYTRNLSNSRGEENRRRLIRDGLPSVAREVRTKAKAFLKQRESLILDILRQEMARSQSESFSRILARIVKVMDVQAGSIFGGAPKSDTLECLATTGFLVQPLCEASPHHGLSKYGYSMERDSGSFTVCASQHPWEPIRMNRTNDPSEEGLPGWLPVPRRPLSLFTEAIGNCLPRKRRLLVVGFNAPDGAVGVIRLIRTQRHTPFLHCDENLIVKIARQLTEVLGRWSSATTSANAIDRPMYGRIEQPQICEPRLYHD